MMTRQGIMDKMRAAVKLIDLDAISDILPTVHVEPSNPHHTVENYWLGSASTSYCNSVAGGNVRIVHID